MCVARNCILVAASASVVTLVFSLPASAQCVPGRMDFQNTSAQTGNPFQAEYTSTIIAPPPLGHVASPLSHGANSLTRDSQGRIRVERSVGKYKVKPADGAETESDRTLIFICDPVNHTSIELDSASKTATILRRPSALPRVLPGRDAAEQSFCSSVFAMRRRLGLTQAEDLGHRLIEGFDAQGLRTSRTIQGPSKPITTSQEAWCSDALGAILLQVSESSAGTRNETLLTKIVRQEPDPALFEIPPDYTIVERLQEGNRLPFGRSQPAPSAPKYP
jgi:hypothetical protein